MQINTPHLYASEKVRHLKIGEELVKLRLIKGRNMLAFSTQANFGQKAQGLHPIVGHKCKTFGINILLC